jgi:tetratricopeptide (TPR) repeat protein
LLQGQALAGFREIGAVDLVADSLVRLAEIHVIAGDTAAAFEAAERARVAITKLGDVPMLPATLHRLRARAHLASGQIAKAQSEFSRALECATRDGYPYEQALAEIGLGRIEGDDARIERAMANLAAMDVLAPPPGT